MHVHHMSADSSFNHRAVKVLQGTHPDPFLISLVRMLIAPAFAWTWCPLPKKGVVTSSASLPLSTCLILLADIAMEWVVVDSHMTIIM